jgi:hypothetical protein
MLRYCASREQRTIGTSESLYATVVLLAYFYTTTSQDMDGSAEPSQSSVPRIKLMLLLGYKHKITDAVTFCGTID